MKKLIALLLALVLLAGCAPAAPVEHTHTVIDHDGVEVTLPEKVERIVVCDILPLPSVLAVFFDSAEKIVGMSGTSMNAAEKGLLGELYPEILEAETGFIDGTTVNAEELMKLQPDVVFYNASRKELGQQLRKAGFPAVAISVNKWDYDCIETLNQWAALLGEIFPENDRREQVAAYSERIFDLVQDGVVGKATWYKIKEIFNGVKKLSDITSEGLTISEAQREYPRVLQIGDSGLGVRTVQYYLAFLGYIWTQLAPISITGTFDEATRNAVLTFQQRSGLKVDGIVGRETWNRLRWAYNATLANLPPDYQAFAEDIYPGRFFAPGDSGSEVRNIQENLLAISRSDPSVPAVEVTGTFDAATENAVKALQRQLGYAQNGVVGPIMWSEIVTRGRGY